METEIRQHEEALRLAMLTSDLEALDSLIADDLIFVGPSGEVFHKQDDLALHRSGRQRLTLAEWESVKITVQGHSAVTAVAAQLSGTFDGAAFSGRFRYCRFWTKTDAGWRVLGGSVVAVPSG
ncbi:nuclear transport factor 2 family protein [uncultured Stenotrophomonas sp.]|uniref:nuclear transport factor 2 family protein n=1 Tax=uncultured Stenotrophomonas sp. TaxID=165438 RepID=UPI0028EA426F|nr:nuclear transport factor 2 family protein [uncultured Stenotrophomonas sp.]